MTILTLALAEVEDIDLIKSFSPLAFDLSARRVKGPAAILRRILYRWCIPAGFLDFDRSVGLVVPLLDLEGYTFSTNDLAAKALAFQREAEGVDYVLNAPVEVTLTSAGRMDVSARVTLIDGKTYPLEVLASQVSAALLALGGT
jgi:hypothetical protein